MSFDVKDYFRHYSKRGDDRSVFNVARSDDEDDGLKFYAYINDEGSYVIQRITTSGTLKIYQYYASKNTSSFSNDWSGRASLGYQEYYQLFQQNL